MGGYLAQVRSTIPQRGGHIRTKNIIRLLATGLTACSMLGCGQKNIKGQVFIVTTGAENIKLGLVEVLVLDEQSVAVFLKKKKPAVEQEVSLRADNLRKAEHELQVAQHELEEFQKTDEAFQPAFVELKIQYAALEREIRELENGPTESILAIMKQTHDVEAQRADSLDAAGEKLMKLQALSSQLAAIDQQEKENAPEIARKRMRFAELWKQITAVSASSDKKLQALSDRVAACSAAFNQCRTAMESFPNLQFYFSDPLPTPYQKTLTDADGRFEIKLPRMKRFAVFAQSSRKVATDTEKYVWFFWLPGTSDNTPLMLSNNNLIFIDYPDNVLPIKPKAVD